MGNAVNIAAAMGGVPARERTIEVITDEILHYKNQAGAAIVEIGRRLIEAKEKLSHGEWLPWLKERVEFSERLAQSFMLAARRYEANPQPVADFGLRKALALKDFTDEAIKEFDAANDIKAMSARELEQALADKKAAEQARDKMANDMRVANERIAAAQAESDAAAAREAALRAELEELRKRPIEVVGSAVPDAKALDAARAEGAEAARREAEDLQAKLAQAEEAKRAAAEKLREAKERAKQTTQAVELERDTYKQRAEQLEKQLKLAGNKNLSSFQAHFEATQESFNRALGYLALIGRDGQTENYDKLVDALHAMLAALNQKIPAKVGCENAD